MNSGMTRELRPAQPRATLLTNKCCRGDFVDDLLQEISQAITQLNEIQDLTIEECRKLSLSELVNRHDRHHAVMRRVLYLASVLFSRVLERHAGGSRELVRAATSLRLLASELSPHMLKEEQVVFPLLLHLEKMAQAAQISTSSFATIRNPIKIIVVEHQAALELLTDLRERTQNYVTPADACSVYTGLYAALRAMDLDLQKHIEIEENILFPMAIALENQLSQGLS
jgi:iron-sulfur cluster repair di-iron protein